MVVIILSPKLHTSGLTQKSNRTQTSVISSKSTWPIILGVETPVAVVWEETDYMNCSVSMARRASKSAKFAIILATAQSRLEYTTYG